LTLVLAALAAPAVLAQSGATQDTMQLLREKLKMDKKLLVAANMQLNDVEAKNFWPIYEDYQKELHKINDRIGIGLSAYAKEYNAGTFTDTKARLLLDQFLKLEEDETKLKRAFVPRLAKVLPGIKVARYMQLENKIRALVKYELAGEVPLAP
jgi:hypothetical protein